MPWQQTEYMAYEHMSEKIGFVKYENRAGTTNDLRKFVRIFGTGMDLPANDNMENIHKIQNGHHLNKNKMTFSHS